MVVEGMEGEGEMEEEQRAGAATEGAMEVVDRPVVQPGGGGAPCTTEARPLVLAEMARLVHIDMKGGPPRPQYLVQLLPLLKQWGATGLLVEWEDMFPWQVHRVLVLVLVLVRAPQSDYLDYPR